jgi:hypothetical protein
MKIRCYCGATISDTSDYLSHKGHLTPDQDLYDVYDAMDETVIDKVASGELSQSDAYMMVRRIMSNSTRLMWQCFECGRLYIDGLDGELHCFVPADEKTDYRVLRSKKSK